MEGLPKTLEIMLSTMVEKFDLKSWQIFDERDGICMKIRFKTVQENQCSTGEPQMKSAKFRKISPSQMKRDHSRAREYNHRPKVMDRKDSEIEMARTDDGSFTEPVVVSPVSVESDCLSELDCNIVEPECSPPACPVKELTEVQQNQDCDHQVSRVPSPYVNEDQANYSDSSEHVTQLSSQCESTYASRSTELSELEDNQNMACCDPEAVNRRQRVKTLLAKIHAQFGT